MGAQHPAPQPRQSPRAVGQHREVAQGRRLLLRRGQPSALGASPKPNCPMAAGAGQDEGPQTRQINPADATAPTETRQPLPVPMVGAGMAQLPWGPPCPTGSDPRGSGLSHVSPLLQPSCQPSELPPLFRCFSELSGCNFGELRLGEVGQSIRYVDFSQSNGEENTLSI